VATDREDWTANDGDGERGPEDLLGSYVGRLNAGEQIQPEEILLNHPTHGPEILEQLEAFIGPTEAGAAFEAAPLGILGDYTLRRQIGRGGMGVVYEAWQNSMDRRVALKVMPKAVAVDTRAVARFIREAQLAGKLSHPNIVHVHGMGVEQQIPYYAMDFVEGETLAQIVAKLKETEPEAETPFGKRDDTRYFANIAEAFADVADGLQHAHAKGVTHRDIKPSNIILDGEGRLRILDFGLARLEGQEGLTISGDFVGTPQYMSPEQARRKKIPVDHRTDVYSLGATLYEMLALRTPFSGRDHQDTLSQIIERDPVEPRKVNSRIPKDLETIVLKCLRKDAGDRYGTAEAMGQDLGRFVRGEVIEARPQAGWERVARRVQRHKWRFAAAASLAVMLLVVAWLAWTRYRDERERLVKEYEPKVLGAILKMQLGSLTRKTGLEDYLTFDRQGQVFSAKFNQDIVPAAGMDRVEDAVKELTEAAGAIPEKPDALYQRARALLLLGDEAGALEDLVRAAVVSPRFVPALCLRASLIARRGEKEAAKVLDLEAEQASADGWQRAWFAAYRLRIERSWAAAAEALGELVELEGSVREPYVGCGLESRLQRSIARIWEKDYVGALRDIEVVQSRWRGSVEASLLEGRVHCLREKPEQAERVFIKTFQQARYPDEVALAVWGIYTDCMSMGNCLPWAELVKAEPVRERHRAMSLYFVGRYEEAVESARKAIALSPDEPDGYCMLAHSLRDRSKGYDDVLKTLQAGIERIPWSAYLLWTVGHLHSSYGHFDEALLASRRASQLEPDMAADGKWNLGICLVFNGASEEGLRLIHEAISAEPWNVYALFGQGVALEHLGKVEDALSAYDRAIELNPRFAFSHKGRGGILERRGRLDEAAEEYRRAIAGFPRRADPYNALGSLLEKQGKVEAAFDEYIKALAVEPRSAEAHRKILALLRGVQADHLASQLNGLVDGLEGAHKSAKSEPRVLHTLAVALSKAPGRRDMKRAVECCLSAIAGSSNADGSARGIVATLESLLDPTAPDAIDIAHLTPQDGTASAWLMYFEGQALERSGKHQEAVEKLAEALTTGSGDLGIIWELWAAIQLASLRRSPAETLEDFPAPALPEGYAADLHWLIERFAAGEGIRLNCGGEDHRGADGALWSRDRFFSSGNAARFSVEIPGTSDAPIYQVERSFPSGDDRPGYRLPLPPGRYRVALHFAELWFRTRGSQLFDVIVEGERVLESFEPLAAGFGVPEKHERTVEVKDGVLEIEFVHCADNPKLSAIEVERVE
jgi:tetratricopeptide (TPR) repeat protein